MAYDVLEESVALIDSREVEPVRRLTRRRRFAPLGVDVSGDLAVTLFARRGVGSVWQETHVLARRAGAWTWLGGGGGTSDERVFADRPGELPDRQTLTNGVATASDPRVMFSNGAGGVLDDQGRADGLMDGARWVSYAIIEVSALVGSVEVFGRPLTVPWHGHVPLVWCDNPQPHAIARDRSGDTVGELRLHDTHGCPSTAPD